MRLTDDVAENRLLSRWAALLPRDPRQRGGVHETDAELMPLGDGRHLALTVDTVDEEIRLGLYERPFTAGRIAAVAALSDLAAVGAAPLGLLLSVTLPDAEGVQDEVARGVADACRDAGVHVLGGDTNEGERLTVGCVGAGIVDGRPLTRTGARPGDLVYASGLFGCGSALAASKLLGVSHFDETRFRPPVRSRAGLAIRDVATAAIDSSDGLVAALDQLARVSEVAIRIERPLHELLSPEVEPVRSALGLPAFPFLASPHGEFELVFTVPADRRDDLLRAAGRAGFEPVAIGHVESGAGLFARGVAIDGARVRNLYGECRGDLRGYVRALVACMEEG